MDHHWHHCPLTRARAYVYQPEKAGSCETQDFNLSEGEYCVEPPYERLSA